LNNDALKIMSMKNIVDFLFARSVKPNYNNG